MCEDGRASLLRGRRRTWTGGSTVTLDAPIDITLAGLAPARARRRRGRRAAGHAGDRAGAESRRRLSTSTCCSTIPARWEASASAATDEVAALRSCTVAKAGLVAAAVRDTSSPPTACGCGSSTTASNCVGEATGADMRSAGRPRCAAPNGGTEIGRAFDAAIASGEGRKHRGDRDRRQELGASTRSSIARTGIRVTAVLIGEDALEAGIAHLAGMTGGQVVRGDRLGRRQPRSRRRSMRRARRTDAEANRSATALRTSRRCGAARASIATWGREGRPGEQIG